MSEPRRPQEQEGGDDVRSNEDLTQTAAAGLRWIAYARIGIEIILFGSMIVLARLIPPAAFGIFAVVAIVQELALMMPMEGVGGALVQRRDLTRDHLQGGLALSILISIGLTLATVLLALLVIEPIFGGETASLTIATSPCFLIGAVYAVPMATLRRNLDFRRVSMIELALNVARSGTMLALAFAGLEAPALVFGTMAGLAVALVMALWFAPIPLPRWRKKAIRELLPYGGPATLATIAWTGFRNGDYAVIGGVLGPAQAGFYWRSYQLAVEYQGKIANAMAQVAFPVLARTAGHDEMLELRQRMVQLLAALVYPLLALLAVIAPVFVPWLFGSAWEPAVVPTQILVVGGAVTLAINACGSALQAAGRAKALLGFGVAHFIVYVGAVLVVAPRGIEAVAAAGSAVHAVFLGVAYIVLLKDKVRNPLLVLWQDLRPATLACAALAVAALGADRGLDAIGAPALVEMAGVCVLGGAVYLVALRWWFPATARDLGALIGRILPDRLKFGRGSLDVPALAES